MVMDESRDKGISALEIYDRRAKEFGQHAAEAFLWTTPPRKKLFGKLF
jgi:hypothetical protein